MENSDATAIISRHIGELELSPAFKKLCSVMGFNTLEDIINTEPEELLNTKGFNYNWFGELITFLSDRKLLHLLQPIPGSNRG